jgi:hypothetical protein
MNARDRAEAWLIGHNHHACHLNDGVDGDVPLQTDIDSLASLLDEVRQEALGEVVEATAKRPR